MLELLTQMGLPVAVIIAIAVIAVVLNSYYNYRLEQEKQKLGAQLQTIQKIHADRFDSITEAGQHIRDFYHYVMHVQDGNNNYKKRVDEQYKKLRSFAREHVVLLGDDFEKTIYALTDAGKKVLSNDFDENQFQQSHRKILELQRALLRKIPGIPKDMIR